MQSNRQKLLCPLSQTKIMMQGFTIGNHMRHQVTFPLKKYFQTDNGEKRIAYCINKLPCDELTVAQSFLTKLTHQQVNGYVVDMVDNFCKNLDLNQFKNTTAWKVFMNALNRKLPHHTMFEIFVDRNSHAGAIIVFYFTNKQDETKCDVVVTLCAMNDTRGYEIWPEDVIAQMIKQGLLVTNGQDIFLEWKKL